VEELSKKYMTGMLGRQQYSALDQVGFTVKAGETVGLVGESGCGKSTLARTILGLIPPSSGRVFFQGREALTANGRLKKELCGKMQIIFQHPESALNPRMKISESLLEPLSIQQKNLQPEKRKRDISLLLERVGLSAEHLSRYPHELSGGQIQRVVLARILSLCPEFIVADEPTSMLDVSVQAQVLRILKEIQTAYQIGLLFISHDLEVVNWMSDRIMVMYKGQIVESAPADVLCQNPLHPYSRLLVETFSSLKDAAARLGSGYGGQEPAANGCVYRVHCPQAEPLCRQRPELVKISGEHYTACWLAERKGGD